MFAQEIKTKFLGRLDVKANGRVGGRGINSIRPQPLFECPHLKDRFVIQQNRVITQNIAAKADLTEPQIAIHLVRAFAGQSHPQRIKMRIIR